MSAAPDLRAYRRIVVAFSGGKDSLAALLYLLALGVPAHAIELHHHDVDGHGASFMDWPCTGGYVRTIAVHLGVAIYFSWRDGGFARELDRSDTPTAPIRFETPDGMQIAGGKGPAGTRGLFPQTSPDLRVRWCSPALKIDVLAAAIRNQPRFLDGRTLVVTGERAEESPARAHYGAFEPHRTATANRHVDHWRPIHGWTEAQVWDTIAASGIRPHPAYVLGWGRLSCRTCISLLPISGRRRALSFQTRFAGSPSAKRPRAGPSIGHGRWSNSPIAAAPTLLPPFILTRSLRPRTNFGACRSSTSPGPSLPARSVTVRDRHDTNRRPAPREGRMPDKNVRSAAGRTADPTTSGHPLYHQSPPRRSCPRSSRNLRRLHHGRPCFGIHHDRR